ncbi:MAG TPA: dynamin family protein [Myxococcales bacterium]|nr:dynamin family protein [Myxococcales bacterium]
MTAGLPDPAEVKSLVQRALGLPWLAPERPRLERLVEDYARGVDRPEAALVLAVVGATGAGKSTLVNALAGEPVAQEGENRPTTRQAVIYAPEDAILEGFDPRAAKVARYQPRPDAPASGQVFIDTPDTNSVNPEHRELARALLERADVALAVMHRGSVAEASQLEFLREFARRRRLLFVVNFADQLGAASRDELKQQARDLAEKHLGVEGADVAVFAVSALKARTGVDASGEWTPFLQAVRDLSSRASVEKVRRSNAAAVLAEVQEVVEEAEIRADAAVLELRNKLEKGMSSAGEGLRQNFAARMEAAGVYLSSEIRRHAAGRFWGPSSWWLRLSALSGGGMTAAALVARRSLPAGVALGAAAAVADKVQSAARARSAEGWVVRTDDDGTVASLARAAVGGVRSAAHLLGVSPEQAGLPDVDELLSALLEVRANAWRHIEGQAVGLTVARWWAWAKWLLVPLLNLPLLALLGHVAFKVVQAYLWGPLLPPEYFANAIALALVVSVTGAMLGSLTLAGATAAVRRAGRDHFERGLDQLAHDALEQVGAPLQDARDAASQLAGLQLP